jgi:hypothetical protein
MHVTHGYEAAVAVQWRRMVHHTFRCVVGRGGPGRAGGQAGNARRGVLARVGGMHAMTSCGRKLIDHGGQWTGRPMRRRDVVVVMVVLELPSAAMDA